MQINLSFSWCRLTLDWVIEWVSQWGLAPWQFWTLCKSNFSLAMSAQALCVFWVVHTTTHQKHTESLSQATIQGQLSKPYWHLFKVSSQSPFQSVFPLSLDWPTYQSILAIGWTRDTLPSDLLAPRRVSQKRAPVRLIVRTDWYVSLGWAHLLVHHQPQIFQGWSCSCGVDASWLSSWHCGLL